MKRKEPTILIETNENIRRVVDSYFPKFIHDHIRSAWNDVQSAWNVTNNKHIEHEIHRWSNDKNKEFEVFKFFIFMNNLKQFQFFSETKVFDDATCLLEKIKFQHKFDEVMLKIKKENNFDYSTLMDYCESKITKKKAKYNLIVPVRKRENQLTTFLIRLNSLLEKKPDWCITVILQEENKTVYEQIKNTKYNFNLNLIHLPHSKEIFANQHMNKSLCYNLASKFIDCEWQINHDVDLLFNKDFIENIEEKTKNKNLTWLQPYRGSRVIHLPKPITEQLVHIIKNINNGITLFVNEEETPPLNKTPKSVGAPGGSIVVRKKVFDDIGGYDPEFVWGYGPEDSIFWRKLEYYYKNKIIKNIDFNKQQHHPFERTDVFSHDTNVELFHMYHEPTKGDYGFVYWTTWLNYHIINGMTDTDIEVWFKLSKENYNK